MTPTALTQQRKKVFLLLKETVRVKVRDLQKSGRGYPIINFFLGNCDIFVERAVEMHLVFKIFLPGVAKMILENKTKLKL